MKTSIKFLITAIAILAFALLAFCTKANAASVLPTITEITPVEYSALKTGNPISWVARFQAGGTQGTPGNGDSELLLTINGVPLPSGQHNWVYPQTVGLYFGYGADMISLYAGTTNLGGTSTVPFNALLMRVTDVDTGIIGSYPLAGSVSFKNGTFVMDNQMTNISNILVDDNSKYFLVDLGKVNPQFKIEGMFNARNTGTDRGYIEFTGVYIPEPSTALFLSAFLLLFSVFRRR